MSLLEELEGETGGGALIAGRTDAEKRLDFERAQGAVAEALSEDPPVPEAEPEVNQWGFTQDAWASLPEKARAALEKPAATTIATSTAAEPAAKPQTPEDVAALLSRVERMEKVENDRVVASLAKAYPELKNPKALEAITKMGPDLRANVVTLYGDRRADAKAQLFSQLSMPAKSGADGKTLTKDDVNRAVWDHVANGGTQQGARLIKHNLSR